MSDKNSILLVDPEFDPITAAECTLLLKITSDSISYAIIDKRINRLQVIYDCQECTDIENNLDIILKSDTYLSLPFQEIKAAVHTINLIALPIELDEAVDLNVYDTFLLRDESSNLFVQSFLNFGLKSIFTIPRSLETKISALLKNCKLYNQTAPTLTLAGTAYQDTLILDFTAGSMNALLLKDHKIIFQNYFEIANTEEFNYYLLLLIKQINIDGLSTTVSVSGVLHDDDPYFSIIKKYFAKVKFNTPLSEKIDYTLLENMPEHYYTSLLALNLCE